MTTRSVPQASLRSHHHPSGRTRAIIRGPVFALHLAANPCDTHGYGPEFRTRKRGEGESGIGGLGERGSSRPFPQQHGFLWREWEPFFRERKVPTVFGVGGQPATVVRWFSSPQLPHPQAHALLQAASIRSWTRRRPAVTCLYSRRSWPLLYCWLARSRRWRELNHATTEPDALDLMAKA